MDPWAVLSGFSVGGIVGVTGVGGGSLMTPLLIGFFGLLPAVAIGTDLCFAAATKAAGAWAHQREGHVERRPTLLLLAGSIPASLATLGLLAFAGGKPSWQRGLTVALGVALLLTALAVARRGFWMRLGQRLAPWLNPVRQARLTVAAGALLGLLVTLSSIGAGAIGASLLLLLYPALPAQRIVGTDIAHAVPLTLVAGAGHAWLGNVDWTLLLALLVGSVPGIWLTARLSKRLPEQLVRSLLCAALLLAGFKVLT